MQLTVKDGNGQAQVIVVAGAPEVVADETIALTGGNDVLLPADADRSGWLIQNLSGDPVRVNELGANAQNPPAAGAASWVVEPGAIFPPPGFPLTIGAIQVSGTAGDFVLARQW